MLFYTARGDRLRLASGRAVCFCPAAGAVEGWAVVNRAGNGTGSAKKGLFLCVDPVGSGASCPAGEGQTVFSYQQRKYTVNSGTREMRVSTNLRPCCIFGWFGELSICDVLVYGMKGRHLKMKCLPLRHELIFCISSAVKQKLEIISSLEMIST